MVSGSEKAMQWLNMAHVTLVARRGALTAGQTLNTRQIEDLDAINTALLHIDAAKDILRRDHSNRDDLQWELPF